MWVRSLGWEDPLEEEMAAHSSILAWKRISLMDRGALRAAVHGVTKNWTRLRDLAHNTVIELTGFCSEILSHLSPPVSARFSLLYFLLLASSCYGLKLI